MVRQALWLAAGGVAGAAVATVAYFAAVVLLFRLLLPSFMHIDGWEPELVSWGFFCFTSIGLPPFLALGAVFGSRFIRILRQNGSDRNDNA
jgi:hypothetical protein